MTTEEKVAETLLNGPIRICRKCRHHHEEDGRDICLVQTEPRLNKVTGQLRIEGPRWRCEDTRASSAASICGPDGNKWEPKPKRTWREHVWMLKPLGVVGLIVLMVWITLLVGAK